MQSIRDFPQTKLDNRINSPFLLNKYGDTRFFFHMFAKNSLMKYIFEEEKGLIGDHHFFFWKMVPNWVYLAKARTSS